LALGNNLGLEVNGGWVDEESWLDTNSLNASSKTNNCLVVTGKLQGQNEVLGVLDTLGLVLKLKDEWL